MAIGQIPWNKGLKHSEETRRKISEAAKGRISPMRGKKMGFESRMKMSLAKKGGVLSEETRKRMSLASMGSKGFTHTEESKEKMRQARLGGNLTPEHRRKIGESGKGRVFSAEHKRKIGLAHKGELSANWKGGITPQNSKERQLFSETISPLVLARDNYTCQICGQYGGKLHADHIQSWSKAPELRFDITNCRTLCRPCHFFVTYKRKMPIDSKWGYTTTIRVEAA